MQATYLDRQVSTSRQLWQLQKSPLRISPHKTSTKMLATKAYQNKTSFAGLSLIASTDKIQDGNYTTNKSHLDFTDEESEAPVSSNYLNNTLSNYKGPLSRSIEPHRANEYKLG